MATTRPSSGSPSRRSVLQEEIRRNQLRARRRSRLLVVGGVLVALAVIVVAVVAVALRPQSKSGPASTAAAAGVVARVTAVPATVFDKVGLGEVQTLPKPLSAAELTADGKPRVLYVGAEYCPYCAAERWALVAALSRFGTFSNLGQTASSASDIYPSTATLSFHGASYQSDYLSFTGKEIQGNDLVNGDYAPLDTLASADEKLLDAFDRQIYTGASDGGIPFLDLGGSYVSSGASYSPGVLKGLSHSQIAADLGKPDSHVAKAILGTANVLTADLCQLTGQKPADVCTSSGVTAAAGK